MIMCRFEEIIMWTAGGTVLSKPLAFSPWHECGCEWKRIQNKTNCKWNIQRFKLQIDFVLTTLFSCKFHRLRPQSILLYYQKTKYFVWICFSFDANKRAVGISMYGIVYEFIGFNSEFRLNESTTMTNCWKFNLNI